MRVAVRFAILRVCFWLAARWLVVVVSLCVPVPVRALLVAVALGVAFGFAVCLVPLPDYARSCSHVVHLKRLFANYALACLQQFKHDAYACGSRFPSTLQIRDCV